ncbi:hypothetical protein L873DRAFT_1070339 [Choiromyces venosus 120613-1]|uniref:Uncharacterized protein n=1 Tax=Choiromyces venosus 120613-1 TaxID=1336337 RepID=A0A3N4K6J8_9PEZI|nr:hypothetical protein L873DRAFT_1070339 [Choiromyces venosus 120613-1]
MTWNIYKLQSLVQPSEFPKHSIPALIPNSNTIIPSTNILIPNTNIPIPNTNHHSDNAFPTFLTTFRVGNDGFSGSDYRWLTSSYVGGADDDMRASLLCSLV